VDHEVCQGHASCWATSPEIYELDGMGYSSIYVVEVAQGFEAAAVAGAAACPERAISIEAEASSES
jgi:ferredoxin